MATTYTRLDKTGLEYLALYILTKLASSPLATNTTYTLAADSADGHKFTLTGSDGKTTDITIPDSNTTYTLSQDSTDKHKITLTGSDGKTNTFTIPDNNTTYTLTQDSKDGRILKFSDGSDTTTITIPDSDTNILESIKVNGTALTITDKSVDITVASGTANGTIKVNGTDVAVTGWSSKADTTAIPTKTSQLTNDSGYQTAANVKSTVEGYGYQTASQVSTAIDTAIASTGHASFKVVATVPAAADAEDNVLYLCKNSKTGYYDIYAKVTETGTDGTSTASVVRLDDVSVDLSGYVQSTEMVALTNPEIQTAVDTAYTSVFGS